MSKIKIVLILLGLQLLAIVPMFWRFLSGDAYFAYTDIGSDTFTAFTPIAQHIARTVAQEGYSGWSFGIGLGSATALWLGDVFMWLNALGGPDNVLPLRIWVYVLKLVLGGMAMLALLRLWFQSGAVQVTGALAYTFCGYVVINGQWDSEAAVFILLPLILWAIVRQLRGGGWLALPLVVALALVCGSFFVSLGVFLALTGVAFVVLSDDPRAMLKAWVTRIAPLMALGFVMAAPALLPMMLQFLDGSRVSGGQNLFDKLLSQGLSVTDLSLIQVQLGSLLHKDIFGVGSAYRGYWNYLEGPGFYIGVMPLLLMAQLARGSTQERRALYWGLAALAAYIVLPVFRLAAMGFAAPYFRVSTLWVTLLLLLLALLALQRVLRDGVDTRMLWAGIACFAMLLIVANLGELGPRVWTAHVVKLIGLALLTAVVLVLAQRRLLPAAARPPALIALVLLDALLVARSSYLEGRQIVTPLNNAYQDGTVQALQTVRNNDPGVYRIEKSYRSVSLADALVQDYRGVASYSFHSKAAADFQVATGLIPPPEQSPAVNYTNWLPDPGPRFMLQSLLGVKYLISRAPLAWPGFTPVSNGHGLTIYRNDFALPLGVVQTRQLTRTQFDSLNQFEPKRAEIFKDIVLMNAVVLDQALPAYGEPFDLGVLLGASALTLDANYFQPARDLQSRGLQLTAFSNTHLAGTVNTPQAGVLVLSMPLHRGWQVRVDGQDVKPVSADMGLTGIPLAAGQHQVALDYQLPGLRVGLMLGALGWGLLVLIGFKKPHE
ncbi:MAG: hypothetical protein COW02_10785 [Comamonadaceae bacterium CG12_big_fil_rev_8_21_14_0_65_59_15]|nr:MAG: hypothetical protein COW02_10785 [Comamonadaceae bacterium CG12_big_fil_rev_8_21_14_0_65_59_15]